MISVKKMMRLVFGLHRTRNTTTELPNYPKETATEVEELKQRFKFVCLKCGSENVVMHVVEYDVGGAGPYTDPGGPSQITFGCNDCKDNDFRFYA